MAKITFEAFGKEYTITSNQDDQQHLENLVATFQDRTEDLQKSSEINDPLRLMVYFSINLLNENIKIKKKSIEGTIAKPITDGLIKKIDEVLNDDD